MQAVIIGIAVAVAALIGWRVAKACRHPYAPCPWCKGTGQSRHGDCPFCKGGQRLRLEAALLRKIIGKKEK